MPIATRSAQSAGRGLWRLAKKQHGVVARRQLFGLGFTSAAIRHRLDSGRLHRVRRGVYAVGRPELGPLGHWMAAVLACGPSARLSHRSAAAAWGMRRRGQVAPIDVSVKVNCSARTPGVRVHRRIHKLSKRLMSVQGIPVTDPVLTLVDIAACLRRAEVEAMINEADKLDLINPEKLRREIDRLPRIRGVGALGRCLDRSTFVLTDSELERRFLPIARAAGLPKPETQRWLNGVRVDFFWPQMGLVVETDGLRYHRTPTQQARDRRRDQAHARAGLTPLRFTHAQVRYEPAIVKATLIAVFSRLAG